MNKIIDIYNQLCGHFPNIDEVKKEDIINAIGYENFLLLTRNLFIVMSRKDENGVYWYEL